MNDFINFDTIKKIPLQNILLELGYTIDKSKTSMRNPVLKNENSNDKIVITKYSNGDYVYYNVNEENDRGNIYNFCKNRNINLKELIKNLNNNEKININTDTLNTKPTNHDLQELESKKQIEYFNKLPSIKNLKYKTFLSTKRALDHQELIKYNIKIDKYNNIYYPNYLFKNGIIQKSGFTLKLKEPFKNENKTIKHIIKGKKGLEIIKNETLEDNTIKNIIISESVIDSLSFKQLYIQDDENSLILGTGGEITKNIETTLEKLKDYMQEKLNNPTIFIAMDKDEKGLQFREKIIKIFENCNTKIIEPQLKDFNDDLKALKMLNKDFSLIKRNYEKEEKTIKKDLKISIYKDINKLEIVYPGEKKTILDKIINKLQVGKITPKEIKNYNKLNTHQLTRQS